MSQWEPVAAEETRTTLGAEHRSAIRYPCRTDEASRLVVTHRHESRWARPRDVSTGGIGLAISGPFPVGTLVLIDLSGRGGTPRVTVLAEVAHATPLPDGSWWIGCRFVSLRGDLRARQRERLRDLLREDAVATAATEETDVRAALAEEFDGPLRDLLRALARRTSGERRPTHAIDALFDVLLAAQGKFRLDRRTCSLADVAARAVNVARGAVSIRDAGLTLTMSREALIVDADAVRLQQVLARLVTQAVAGGPVLVAARRHGGEAIVRIGSPGAGPATDPLPSIDEVIGRRKGPASVVGWDEVELALVRRTVELHGGDVRIRRGLVGPGVVFGLRLPLTRPES
jgi:signal transduction histidine kinase